MEQVQPRGVRPARRVRRLAVAILGIPSLVAIVVGVLAGAGGAEDIILGFFMGLVFMGVLALFELRALRLPPDPSGRVAFLPPGVLHEATRDSIRSLAKAGLLLPPFVALATVVNGVGIPSLMLGIAAAAFLLTLRVERWESRQGVRLMVPVGRRIWERRPPYTYVEPMDPSTSDA
jgi:hypothetical protein